MPKRIMSFQKTRLEGGGNELLMHTTVRLVNILNLEWDVVKFDVAKID